MKVPCFLAEREDEATVHQPVHGTCTSTLSYKNIPVLTSAARTLPATSSTTPGAGAPMGYALHGLTASSP